MRRRAIRTAPAEPALEPGLSRAPPRSTVREERPRAASFALSPAKKRGSTGALDGLDAFGNKQVNKTNADNSVRWVQSCANADETKTFCIDEAPNEKAKRAAAAADELPVDEVVEIPLVLKAQ